MNIFFDVDDTLLTWDHRLRPHTHAVMQSLSSDGATIYLWSGAGLRYEVVWAHGLRDFIAGCFVKPLSQYHRRLAEHGIPFIPDFVVDDDPDVVAAFGGTHVPSPLEPLEHDAALLRVIDDVRQFGLRLPEGAGRAVEGLSNA